MFRRILTPLLAAMIVLLARSRCQAWFDEGHMVIAKIAWDQLDATQRTKAIAILNELPSRDKTLLAGMSGDLPQEKRDEYMFMKAATWPDQLRGEEIVPKDEIHKNWHFIDIPYALDGHRHAQPPMEWKPADGEQGVQNAVQALQWAQWVLRQPGGPSAKKAVALCWYMHLVGDLHQPLHAASLFSKEYPTGDAGGNRIDVSPASGKETLRLHALWDDLLGGSHDPPAAVRRAEAMMRDKDSFGPDAFKSMLTGSYADWARESYELARSAAYCNGDLAAVAHPSEAYLKNARQVAEHRAALAGYRLAAALKILLNDSAK